MKGGDACVAHRGGSNATGDRDEGFRGDMIKNLPVKVRGTTIHENKDSILFSEDSGWHQQALPHVFVPSTQVLPLTPIHNLI